MGEAPWPGLLSTEITKPHRSVGEDHGSKLAGGSQELLRSILHIGAGKCGSSSIQSFLSHHHTLMTGPELSKLAYGCLSKNGLKTDLRIERNLNRQVSGYISSPSVAKISQFSQQQRSSIQDSVTRHPDDLIFSCEGWLGALCQPAMFNMVLELVAPQHSNRDVELIAFVRPPVKWINSAWWQWGVWNHNSDFEGWLKTAIESVQWFNLLSQAMNFPSVKRLTVEPVHQDVVKQLIRIVDIRECEHVRTSSNQSLPAEALQLFVQHRQHRQNAHSSFNDFLIGHAIRSNASQYSPTPWVLRPQDISRILEATHDSNCKLLELMDEENRCRVREDHHWWDAGAYTHLKNIDPYLHLDPAQASPYLLASDLFTSLEVAVEIMRSRGLLQAYLDALAKAQRPDRD